MNFLLYSATRSKRKDEGEGIDLVREPGDDGVHLLVPGQGPEARFAHEEA